MPPEDASNQELQENAEEQNAEEQNVEVEIGGEEKLEGKSEPGKPAEPPVGSPRWTEVYWKAKNSERENEALKADIERMRDHNRELMSAVTSIRRESADESGEPSNLKSQMNALKQERKRAVEQGDLEKIYELEDKIDELRENIYAKPAQSISPGDIEKSVMTAVTKAEVDRAMGKFIRENPWFDSTSPDHDLIMSAAAVAVDNELIPTWRGTVAERFDEVKRRVEERFGMAQPKGRVRPNAPSVEGVGTFPPGTSGKVVLTPDERRVARMAFPDEENPEKMYAEQKVFIAQRKSGRS